VATDPALFTLAIAAEKKEKKKEGKYQMAAMAE